MFRIESHTNGKVSHETETIYQELAIQRAENRHLRAQLPPNRRGSQIVRTAIVDAHQLIMQAFSGQATGRLAMGRQGMGKRRWAWAVAFLRYAGIVSSNLRKWRSGLEFLITALPDCITLLEKAGTELTSSANGYKVLSSHLRDV